MGKKVDELFSPDEVEETLHRVSDFEIRKGLLKSLVDRGLAQNALKIAKLSNAEEKAALFRSLAQASPNADWKVSEEESRFWLDMLEHEPLEVFRRGSMAAVKQPARFQFLLAPLKDYFFEHIHRKKGEFLLDDKPALPYELLRMILNIEGVLDPDVFMPAAMYGGYNVIVIDYRNGYRVGDRTGKNFPVSSFAVSQLEQHGFEIPDSVPDSIPIPYRDPRDR